MERITTSNQKKKLLFAVAAIVSIVAMIIIGLYTTYQTAANQLSTGLSALEEAEMRFDLKVENNGLTEPQTVTSVNGSDGTASSDNQEAGKTSETNSNVEVRVDGTSITVPEDGSVHKVINTEDGSTNIDISTQSSNSSGDSRSRSSINIDSDSNSSVRIRSETK